MSSLSISDFYGKNDNPDISKLWISIIMLIISLCTFLFSINIESIDMKGYLGKWAFSYISIVIFATAVLMSSYYFFEKKEGSSKYKSIRKLYFLVALLLLMIAFLPITITLFVLNRLNMETLFRYNGLYCISLIVSLSINAFLSILVYVYSEFLFGNYIDSMTVCLTFSFIMNYILLKLSGSCYLYLSRVFLRSKWKLKQGVITAETFDDWENRHNQLKKEFMGVIYVMNFAIIALGSAAIYFIKLELIFPDVPIAQVRSSILYSFALYTAYDRLFDKWKKSLSKEEKRALKEQTDMKSLEDELQTIKE